MAAKLYVGINTAEALVKSHIKLISIDAGPDDRANTKAAVRLSRRHLAIDQAIIAAHHSVGAEIVNAPEQTIPVVVTLNRSISHRIPDAPQLAVGPHSRAGVKTAAGKTPVQMIVNRLGESSLQLVPPSCVPATTIS